MPGLLKRPYESFKSDETCDPCVEGEAPRKRLAMETISSNLHVNGDSAPTSGGPVPVGDILPVINGVYANGHVSDPQMTGSNLETCIQGLSSGLPPEIFHITQGYLPLTRLIERLAQDTFNGLNEVINDLSESQTSQINGVGGAASSNDVKRKTRLWDFIQDRRTKFIKILVLSQWSRQAEAVSRVIDINAWLTSQKALYKEATNWVGELKRILVPLKLPAPDLKLALEVLSTGKGAWISDLGFIRPAPLEPRELLEALRTINTLLTIRINIHEKVPPSFGDFSVADGRATFKVQDEFELDVSIADEDMASQLYFVDLRFTFSPCMTELAEGRMRNQIEAKANDVLRREGLPGCYDFLHQLVLTHKLSILRQQAFDMAYGKWLGNVKVEPVHRAVVVQYWLNRPGGKNWIEIGMKRGRRKRDMSASSRPQSPYLALRWFRHGKEVLDHEILMDPSDLSLEAILKEAIASHTNYIFKSVKAKLRAGALYAKKLLSIKHRASPVEPSECSLKVQLSPRNTITVSQETVSGSFAILPPSTLHSRIERELNALRDPAMEASSRIGNLRCVTIINLVHSRVRMFGWQMFGTLNPNQETVKLFFGAEVMRLAFYRMGSSNKRWLLAVTSSLSGDNWWLVETQERGTINTIWKAFHPIRTAVTIQRRDVPRILDPSFKDLERIEVEAAAMLSRFNDCRELQQNKMHYEQRLTSQSGLRFKFPDLFIQYLPPKTNAGADKPWCHEIIQIKFLGIDRLRSSTIAFVFGRLVTPIKNVAAITTNLDRSLAFHPTNGVFAFRLLNPSTQGCVHAIYERFSRIERLVRFLEVIVKNNLRCSKISLTALTVRYTPTGVLPCLEAEITFAPDAPMQINFPSGSPHRHVASFLTTLLSSAGFEYVVALLQTTLPLLSALNALETATDWPVGSLLVILPRSATWYRVRYEKPAMTYEIGLRNRMDKVMWFSTMSNNEDASVDVDDGRQKKLQEGWKKLALDHGDGWTGLTRGIMAEMKGVAELVGRIDAMWRDVAKGDSSEDAAPAAPTTSDELGARGDIVDKDDVPDGSKGKEIVVLD